MLLKFRESRKEIRLSSILPKKQTKLTILSKEHALEQCQDSEFHGVFGRIEETINCFQDLLTFRSNYRDSHRLGQQMFGMII